MTKLRGNFYSSTIIVKMINYVMSLMAEGRRGMDRDFDGQGGRIILRSLDTRATRKSRRRATSPIELNLILLGQCRLDQTPVNPDECIDRACTIAP